ncbi:hypothetical protein SKAU_G00149040 [Synaphobranchus kaupii]|uniref:Uncharacterized protein n=1 Tax=Synaphobranchus kaupii TaxID=118154 RepID=A0A9Q1FU23_SYNKA|nr:hypothetical protein SKAU_G00149040 [Synaphobranchus kaupii]
MEGFGPRGRPELTAPFPRPALVGGSIYSAVQQLDYFSGVRLRRRDKLENLTWKREEEGEEEEEEEEEETASSLKPCAAFCPPVPPPPHA